MTDSLDLGDPLKPPIPAKPPRPPLAAPEPTPPCPKCEELRKLLAHEKRCREKSHGQQRRLQAENDKLKREAKRLNGLVEMLKRGHTTLQTEIKMIKNPDYEHRLDHVRAGKYAIDQVLPFIVRGKRDPGAERDYDGHKVKMWSLRYRLFATRGLKCVKCGLEGQFFALERTVGAGSNNPDRFHFNLYAMDAEGREVLITKDHVIPVSKGGPDHLDNLQVMCVNCNGAKADTTGEAPWRILEQQADLLLQRTDGIEWKVVFECGTHVARLEVKCPALLYTAAICALRCPTTHYPTKLSDIAGGEVTCPDEKVLVREISKIISSEVVTNLFLRLNQAVSEPVSES